MRFPVNPTEYPGMAFTPPDSQRGGGEDDDGKKNKKAKAPKKPKVAAKKAPKTDAVIRDTSDSVYALVWEEKKQFVRDALIKRFGIDPSNEKGDGYIGRVVNGITNTGLFEDITNRGIGIIYTNLVSNQSDILETIVREQNHRVMLFDEQLRFYANYAVRTKVMSPDRLEEYIQFLRDEVYFMPQAQEYDRVSQEVNILLDELRSSPLRRPRKFEIFGLLLEKATYLSNRVIRNK